MIIHSLFGSFCVVANGEKSDGLFLQSKSKIMLNRLFDDKRIRSNNSADYPFYIELCKQEFAHLLITLTKDISYENFDKEISDLEVDTSRVSAR